MWVLRGSLSFSSIFALFWTSAIISVLLRSLSLANKVPFSFNLSSVVKPTKNSLVLMRIGVLNAQMTTSVLFLLVRVENWNRLGIVERFSKSLHLAFELG